MDSVRRLTLVPALGVLGVALILGWIGSRSDLSASASASLAKSTAHFESVTASAAARNRVGDHDVIGMGYLERLRLGLGSPFRLVDEAMHDRRLIPAAQRRVAWALVDRLRNRKAYVVDPSVLDDVGPTRADSVSPRGIDHLALIERAVFARDPRAGELSVRIAYLLAAANGSISAGAPANAALVAAMMRDRELAYADLRDALRDATRGHLDVLDELRRRRAAHAFAVERPTLEPLPHELQVEAMNAVPDLLRQIDSLSKNERLMAPSQRSLLTAGLAARLAALGTELPPAAPIVVTMRMHRERGGPAADAASQARERFTARSVNEETMVASYASIAGSADSVRRVSSAALLSAAVALRPLSQSQPWFPGDPGPTVADLIEEFGLEDVVFDSSVPSAWRPYYLSELAVALRDEQSVLPGFFPDGLRIAFRVAPLPDSALAMHNPKSRTLELSLGTSAGTIAHELAHDLDWQAARQLFAGSTGYSTDRAMREQRGALATSMRGLAEARLIRPLFGGDARRPTIRPAELFAQSADWFVTSALARRGRVNGFLSAVQDPLITGYAASAPTAIGLVGGQSLVSALAQMTYVPDSLRESFLNQWANPATVDPVLLVRRVLETPVSWRSVWVRHSGLTAPPSLASTNDPLACLVPGDSPDGRARLRLLHMAVDARARGVALRRARYRFAGPPAPWAKSLLGVAPWSPAEGERVVRDLRAALVNELSLSPTDQGVVSGAPAVFRQRSC